MERRYFRSLDVMTKETAVHKHEWWHPVIIHTPVPVTQSSLFSVPVGMCHAVFYMRLQMQGGITLDFEVTAPYLSVQREFIKHPEASCSILWLFNYGTVFLDFSLCVRIPWRKF